ncbi:MAG: AraC family transcriptional regulator [Spirochaetia bacterium]|nr:AraC family transcriptional regulator [Spirochaetia bacterium]
MNKKLHDTRIEFPSETELPIYRSSVLYINRSGVKPPKKTRLHSHPFWQLEILVKGRMTIGLEGRRFTLAAGDLAFLPPNRSHDLDYNEKNCRYLSVKFSSDAPVPPGFVGHALALSPQVQAWRECLASLIPETYPAPAQVSRWIGYAVSALLQADLHPLEVIPTNPEKEKIGILKRIRSLVEQKEGRSLAVTEIARELDYSPSHLSTLFKNKTGVVLKTFIEQERSRLIAARLRYSDLRISELSRELSFPDVLVFSHYCRRHLGLSPRAFRKKNSGLVENMESFESSNSFQKSASRTNLRRRR